MRKTLGIMSLAAMGLAAATFAAKAEPEGAGRPGRGEGRHQRVVEYLGLTEEQQATWKSLHEQHKGEMEPLRQEGRDLHQQLRAAMDAENPDPAAVGTATLALKEHREKVKAAREAFEGRLMGVLSAEQKTKFEAFKASHGPRHGRPGFRGRRGPRPGGPSDGSPEAPGPPVEG